MVCIREDGATVNDLIVKQEFPATAINLIITTPRTSCIYFLPKIHKPNNPARPIVSACSCPTELISSYLDKIMAAIVRSRGIEWSLRVFVSMQAVRFFFFLRARAVINFFMRAVSTSEITKGEQRALSKFSASWNLSLLKRCLARTNLADTFKTG